MARPSTRNLFEGAAAELLPERPTLERLREAAAACQACDLWWRDTQTVFDEGLPLARLLLVGEQPGDAEDEAGIDRQQAYVTNVVKHFKWEPRGKRRIHTTPDAREIAACRP